MIKPTTEEEWNEQVNCDDVVCLFFMSYNNSKSMEVFDFAEEISAEFEGRLKMVCADSEIFEEMESKYKVKTLPTFIWIVKQRKKAKYHGIHQDRIR